ncbi:MAG: BMP family ABC transporter substrate-binding protein [Pelolinea sp.]|jgi:basic membrane protein A|nr:BMP family ABC transporter substrate-binding protein [Pelolinea sp.]
MKKILLPLIVLALVSTMLLAACSPAAETTEPAASDETTTEAEPAAETEPITVGVFVADSFGDRAFYDIALNGITMIEDDFGAVTHTYEGKLDYENYKTLLTNAAKTDNIVFVLGFEAIDAMLEVAPQNPDTLYIYLDGVLDSPDVVSLGYKDHEGAFLAGALAGLMTTRTDLKYINADQTIGYVGGVDSPVMQRALWGYEQGLKYVAPEGKLESIFVGSWVDPAKGKEATLALIEKGSDINFMYAGLSGEGGFNAANEGAETWIIGGGFDQRWLSPDYTIASVMKACDVSIHDLTEMYLNGELKKGDTFNWGVKEGGMYLVMSEDLVPADIVSQINALQTKIANGEISVTEFRPQ